ncbi:MAG: clostripain-related cysteine peptidase [Lachnospiraceae bacterium]|nr:clostripain-related cysteine peptidase [Lachnospiraceae bacterium]
MFCTNCGTTLNDGAAFCTNCGQKMAPASAVAAQAVPVADPYAQPVAQAPVDSYAQQAPAADPYAQPVAQAPVDPYAQQAPAADPYAQPVAQAPVDPYAQQAPAADPYAQPVAQAPVDPYAQQAAANPYGQPVADPYAQQAAQAPVDPYAQQAAANPYGQPVDPYAQNGAYAQQGAYNTQQQGAYNTQQPTQAAPAAGQQPKKKSKLGLILGLAIGIPLLLILLAVGGCVACTYGCVNAANSIIEDIDDERDDDDDVVDNTDPVDPVDPIDNPYTPDPTQEKATRTIMMYIVGSNLESPEEYGAPGGAASMDIDEMLAANIPDDVNVVLECGGAFEWVNPNVPDGSVSRHIIKDQELVMVENLGRTTMTKYGDLTDFIMYSVANYPADNYTLLLWDHGGSIPISYGMDQLGDEDDLYTDVELKAEIENAGVHFDTVIFDACNMCTLEIGIALADSSDYMVGAESYVNGIGIYYTNWLAQTAGSTSTFCETIVEDYMDTINSYGLVGSMSVIRLDRIDEVYDAYVDYMKTVDNYVYNYDDFGAYVKARGNCGEYYGTDSVDLTTLANKYETEKSSALINAVSNAVVYTESDMPYGHGITAYSPSPDYFYTYNYGRPSLVELNYDPDVIYFYDKFVSELLSYYGEDVVQAYGGDWYVNNYEVAQAGTSDEINSLATTDMGNYDAVALSSSDWDIVASIATAVVVFTDNGSRLVLGQDYQYMTDSYGYIALADPEYWYYLNGSIATFYATNKYEDDATGKWSYTGYIPVLVNGDEAALYIYFDQDNPQGLIQGYYYFDYATLTRHDNTMYMITDDLQFNLLYPYLDDNGEPYYMYDGNTIYGYELELDLYYINLDAYTTYGYIEIVDVYGNKYQTEQRYFVSRSTVD